MRESNFAFPTQNKAAVCITSQLYDRRALDTTSPLPLLNSLTHLVYLTSTSPRIREIMTMDGGLERLVRIIYDFCLCPPPPENPALMYGLTPPNSRPPKQSPTLNPQSWDKQAAYRFSLAFQCVVNIGVRGSEPIRSRVVQAGTLEVVGMILEAWLVSRGFAVGPSSSATGLPRETKEQRAVRKEAQLRHAREQQQQAMQKDLERRLQYEAALQEQEMQRGKGREMEDQQATVKNQASSSRPALRLRRSQLEDDSRMDTQSEPLILVETPSGTTSNSTSNHTSALPTPSTLNASGSDTEMSTDASSTATPIGSGTPTGSVTIPSRDRSGTVIGRPVWDPPPSSVDRRRSRHSTLQPHAGPGPNTTMMMMGRISPDSPANLTDTSRPETETEDDDVDMDRNANRTITNGTPSATRSSRRGPSTRAQDSSPERSDPPPPTHHHGHRTRRAVGIVSDEPMDSNNTPNNASDAHIIINDAASVTVDGLPGVGVGVDGPVGVVGSVEDGIVSLEPNDDFAMGAPPGAPGAIGEVPGGMGMGFNEPPTALRRRGATVIGGGAQVEQQAGGHQHPDVTPRAGVVPLPMVGGAGERAATTGRQQGRGGQTPGGGRGERGGQAERAPGGAAGAGGANAPHPTPVPPVPGAPQPHTHGHSQQTRASQCTDSSTNPYRDDDVLLGLQLLAYLSKYPHVRQTFYKPRQAFHPATVEIARQQAVVGVWGMQAMQQQVQQQQQHLGGRTRKEKERERAMAHREANTGGATGAAANLFKVFTGGSKERASASSKEAASSSSASSSSTIQPLAPSIPPRQTNVFSLVERFTFKPSTAETEMLPNPPPDVPNDIQYWAGVIMRNACRKDDSRGGIRQCANMLCGKWESYPREFAKCRRCRKAKYCGKECQSTAWSEGHRFWCSAKDEDGHIHGVDQQHQQQLLAQHQAQMQAQQQQQQQMRDPHHHPREREHRGTHANANAGRLQAPNTTPTGLATDGTEQPVFIPPASSAHATAARAERREMREQARLAMLERERLANATQTQEQFPVRPANPGPDSARQERREREHLHQQQQEEMRRQWELQQQQRRHRRAGRGGEEAAAAGSSSSAAVVQQQQQQQPQQEVWASATYSPAMSSRRRAETTSFAGSSTTEAGHQQRQRDREQQQQQRQQQQEVTSPHLNSAAPQQSPWFLLRTRRDARPAGTTTTGQPVSVATTNTGAAAAAEAAGDGSGSPMRLSSMEDDDMMVG